MDVATSLPGERGQAETPGFPVRRRLSLVLKGYFLFISVAVSPVTFFFSFAAEEVKFLTLLIPRFSHKIFEF